MFMFGGDFRGGEMAGLDGERLEFGVWFFSLFSFFCLGRERKRDFRPDAEIR